MFKIPMRFKKQAGYILLEGALALSLAAGVMTYYMAEEKNRFAEDMAKIHGQHMKAMAAATNAYITNNYSRLIAGTAIPIPGSTDDVDDPLAPTVQELMDLGLLPNSPGLATPVYGGGFTIRLTTNPVAGAVNGFVGTTASVAPGGQVSSRTIGRALQEIGINGMATGLGGNPDNELRALNQDNGVAGPDVTLALGVTTPQPGMMAVRVGTGVCNDGTGLACDVFLRRDGTRPMTGDLDMGVNNITNVVNIGTAAARAGTVFSTDLDARDNISAGINITANNNITATTGDVTAGRNVIANNNITATTGDVTAGRNV
ncbi:MAG: hypothetical protein ING30_10170, partial [Burkholderiales bacterium]|nr:hypothetical protein [Burkholderiales bacterium]